MELRGWKRGGDAHYAHHHPSVSRHAGHVPGDRLHGPPHRDRRPGREGLGLADGTRHRAAAAHVDRLHPPMRTVWPLVAAALVAGALPASAAEREKKKRPGRFRVGPVYLTPKLQLKNAGVDTNVFNQRTGEVPDNSVVLSPTMLAAWPVGRRLRLTGEGHVDLNYFRRQTDERSTDFGGEGRAEVDIGPFTLFGAGGGGQSRQRFSIDLDQRVLRHERWGSTGFTVTPTRRVSATVLGTGRVYEYANFLVDGANGKE